MRRVAERARDLGEHRDRTKPQSVSRQSAEVVCGEVVKRPARLLLAADLRVHARQDAAPARDAVKALGVLSDGALKLLEPAAFQPQHDHLQHVRLCRVRILDSFAEP